MEGVNWNLWHGCQKKSEGCKNCYVYRGDAKYDRDSSEVFKTQKFNLPVAQNRKGEYKYPPGSIFWTCFSSDFLLEEADEWRGEAFAMIKERGDCRFFFITKRIERFAEVAPADWGDGYDNVSVGVTCENQRRADERLPIFLGLPIKGKTIICEPLLEKIDLSSYLTAEIRQVVAGGESGTFARDCRYEWVLDLRRQCEEKNVSFHFKQTGSYLVKDGKRYTVERRLQHVQAKKAGIDFEGRIKGYL